MSRVIDVPVSGDTMPLGGEWGLASNEAFVDAVLGAPKRVHHVSRDKLIAPPGLHSRHSLFFQAIHWCYAQHVPLSLRPEVLWYTITFEIATHVRLNPDHYAQLFTTTPGEKQVIIVDDDYLRYEGPSDWGRTIGLFRSELADRVPHGHTEAFLPSFSTSGVEDETALLVSFMDVVSPYYDFAVRTLCGIPRIRLEGTAEDWQLLHDRTSALAGTLDLLGGYFGGLLPVLREVAETAAGGPVDEDFWASLYKMQHYGSGGPDVSGWITAFLAHGKTGRTYQPRASHGWGGTSMDPSDFPTHVSTVPFLWDYHETHIDMTVAAGVLGVEGDDDFLVPRLGFAVAENADPVDRIETEAFEDRQERYIAKLERQAALLAARQPPQRRRGRHAADV